MASLLAKFRIDYSDLQVVPDITSKALECTQQFFDTLIADFRKSDSEGAKNGKHLFIHLVGCNTALILFSLLLVSSSK